MGNTEPGLAACPPSRGVRGLLQDPARGSATLLSRGGLVWMTRTRGSPVGRSADDEHRPPSAAADVFAADVEVGGDLALVDWAATPLGPPGDWPQSLQTAVSILLSSRFPMWMAWGPDLTFFCNSAYRRDTLARKYPWALGRPASEVWAEIWPDIGPRIDTVLDTGKATWDEALL